MANAAITIIEEFLRSGTPQVRKNSLTALSCIEDDESARLIATTALNDDDAGVRKRAEDEALSISESMRARAIAVFADAVSRKEPQKQQRAYAILGQIKSRGFSIPRVRLPWGSRMWLAASMFSHFYPIRKWSFRLRSWKPGLLGSLIGTIPLIIYLFTQNRPLEMRTVLGIGLGSAVLLIPGTLIPIFATQFATPINLQLRRSAASLVEVLLAFFAVFAGLLVLSIIIGLSPAAGETIYRESRVLLLFTILLSFLAAFVRLGTIIAFGRLKFLKSWGRRTWNWLFEICGGVVAGLALATLVYLFFKLDAASYQDSVLYEGVWLGSLAVTVGLATAFAQIDSEAPPA
ncbi:MAG TPA: hypothetical protein VHQ64_02505 [Pyrinomonadaceae bacterium]|nr:hypothetical protein [Pyrinomonadaceae bacterium]